MPITSHVNLDQILDVIVEEDEDESSLGEIAAQGIPEGVQVETSLF